MKASYQKCGIDFLPVIIHEDGKRETLYGLLLCNRSTAIKYANIEINTHQRRPKP